LLNQSMTTKNIKNRPKTQNPFKTKTIFMSLDLIF